MRLVWAECACLWLVGCGSFGPLPEEFAAELPPEANLSEEQVLRVSELTGRAWSELEQGQFERAAAAAESALALDGRAALARAIRARCAMEDARQEFPPELSVWRAAEGDLRLAVRLQPGNPEIGLLHSEFLEADGHLSAAAGEADRVLQANPGHVDALARAARLRYELGEERTAERHLVALLERTPNDRDARYRLAQCRLRLAKTADRELDEPEPKRELFAQAADAFAAYRLLAPGDAEGLSGEAFARFRLLELRDAEPDDDEIAAVLLMYERASALAERSPEHEYNIGIVREFAGDPAGAQLAYEKALQRDPEHLPSLLNLAANLAQDERPEEAAPYCERALKLGPSPTERRELEKFLAR